MTEKPFVHKKALTDVYLNFIFQDEIAAMIPKIIRMKGTINVGGPTRTVYQFAKKYNPYVKKVRSKREFPPKPYMNLSKLYRIKKI